MNYLARLLALSLGLATTIQSVLADTTKAATEREHVEMKEDLDGELEEGEYQRVSLTNSITRAFCPYSCEDRKIPKEQCRTWKSIKDRTLCYVEDTSNGSRLASTTN